MDPVTSQRLAGNQLPIVWEERAGEEGWGGREAVGRIRMGGGGRRGGRTSEKKGSGGGEECEAREGGGRMMEGKAVRK